MQNSLFSEHRVIFQFSENPRGSVSRSEGSELENRKSPEQIKADVSRIIIAKSNELKNWFEIPDEKVKEIKDALKKALDLPSLEQISISNYDTGRDNGVLFSVQSSTNPLRRYLYAHCRGNGEIGMMELNLPSGHDSTNDVQKNINALFRKTLNIPMETKVDFEYKDVGNGITRHTIIDRESKALLGIIDVNEKTATIIRSQRNETAIEAAKPRSLKDCMTLLAKEGRTRNPLVRKTVEEALRKELQLPEKFSDRALLITAKQEGKYIEITVEDKDSEQIIAEVQYNTEFDEFSSQKMYKAVINQILNVKK